MEVSLPRSSCFNALASLALIVSFAVFTHALLGQDSGRADAGVMALAESTPELPLIGEATRLASAGDLDGAWHAITSDARLREKEGADASVLVGSRALVVASFLGNNDRYAAEEAFARHALKQAWLVSGAREDKSQARGHVRYLAARLELHIPDGRGRALALLRQAKRDDPEFKEIADWEKRVEAAERAFGRSAK